MKIDRIDVCHQTIQDETCESLVVSVLSRDEDDEYEVRFNLNYRDEISPLVELCVSEMNTTPEVREFFLMVSDQYFEQYD
jgi:hypothetical protein